MDDLTDSHFDAVPACICRTVMLALLLPISPSFIDQHPARLSLQRVDACPIAIHKILTALYEGGLYCLPAFPSDGRGDCIALAIFHACDTHAEFALEHWPAAIRKFDRISILPQVFS